MSEEHNLRRSSRKRKVSEKKDDSDFELELSDEESDVEIIEEEEQEEDPEKDVEEEEEEEHKEPARKKRKSTSTSSSSKSRSKSKSRQQEIEELSEKEKVARILELEALLENKSSSSSSSSRSSTMTEKQIEKGSESLRKQIIREIKKQVVYKTEIRGGDLPILASFPAIHKEVLEHMLRDDEVARSQLSSSKPKLSLSYDRSDWKTIFDEKVPSKTLRYRSSIDMTFPVKLQWSPDSQLLTVKAAYTLTKEPTPKKQKMWVFTG